MRLTTGDAHPFHDNLVRQSPFPKRCICPGKEVPFYCPIHGAVENPDWPLLHPPAAVLDSVKDDEARLTAATLSEEAKMANVFVEPRPKGRQEGSAIEDYVVEDHADHVLATFKTQREAIEWDSANHLRFGVIHEL